MYRLLHVWVHSDHAGVEIRMLAHECLWVPSGGNEERVDPARQRDGEALRNLQANQERIRDNDRGEVAVGVVRGFREDEVQIREQGAGVSHEGRAHGEDGPDEALVDEGVNSTVFDQTPGGLCGAEVGVAVQGHIAEGVAIYELHRPV